MRKKDLICRILISVLLLFGYTCVMLPTMVDTYSRIGQTATISGLESIVDDLDDEEIEEAFQKSEAYNQAIYEKDEYYVYSSKTEYDSDYLTLPLSQTDEICRITIDKINVDVSVGHGTGDDLLQREAGHMYGTSLPVGGANTHAAIAAHSALRSSELFTRLDELEKGDVIDITVLGQVHRYVVDQIVVCLPEDCNKYLQIEEGKDLITLYTCTPYGINTHRLLVRASRVNDVELERTLTENATEKTVKTKNIGEIMKLGGMIAGPIVLVIVWNVVESKDKKKVKKK